MKFAIDARGAFLYHGTGIGTYTDNLISQMINLDSQDEFTLFCSAKFNSDYNKDNTHIIFSSGRHGSFYEKYYFPNKLLKNNIDLYHIPQNGIGFESTPEITTVVTLSLIHIFSILSLKFPLNLIAFFIASFTLVFNILSLDPSSSLAISRSSSSESAIILMFIPFNIIFSLLLIFFTSIILKVISFP